MKRPGVLFALFALVIISPLTSNPRGAAARQLGVSKAAAAAALEQEVLREINLARTRPTAYASYLEELRPHFRGMEYSRPGRAGLQTTEGVRALEDAIGFLRATKPVSALTLSRGMCSGAGELVREQSGSNATGHKGADGSFCEQRAQRFGNWTEPIGENLSYGEDNARAKVIALLIDDGFASRGHRKRLFDPSFRVAGVACGDHKLGAMCVITLAGGFNDAARPAQPAGKTTTLPVPAGARRF